MSHHTDAYAPSVADAIDTDDRVVAHRAHRILLAEGLTGPVH
ncbi:hypothetical protein [Nocardia tengchongensis]